MKKVYLTIDDAPSERMGDLINLLKKKQIPALFFCIGKNLKRYPNLAIEAVKNGFILGNHSWSHPHFSKLSIENCFIEIQRTDEMLDEIYQQARVQRTVKWFRFPYGDKGDGRMGRVFDSVTKLGLLRHQIIQSMLRGLGYALPDFPSISYPYYQQNLAKDADWHWTFDVMEWSLREKKPVFNINNISKIIERIRQEKPVDCRGKFSEFPRWLGSPSTEIILLHDHKETAAHLPAILQELLEKRLSFQSFASIPPPKKQ